jgi:hypothetical protein
MDCFWWHLLASVVPLSLAFYCRAIDLGELDVIQTEFQRCLSEYSYAHWLVRGHVEYLNYAAPEPELFEAAKNYAEYLLILPFCVILGKLMNGRYGASVALNSIAAFIAFLSVVNVTWYAVKASLDSAVEPSKCAESSAQRAFAKYNSALVMRQIADRINQDIKRSWPDAPKIVGKEHGLAFDVAFKVNTPPGKVRELTSAFIDGSRKTYCNNGATFRIVRAIGVPLVVTVRETTGRTRHTERSDLAAC